MKKFTALCTLSILALGAADAFAAVRPASFKRTAFYLSIKGSWAMPDVSGDKERFFTTDNGVTYTRDFSGNLDTDTESKVGFKPSMGVQFNVPEIYGNIRLEVEYAAFGKLATTINSSQDIVDSANLNTNNPLLIDKLASSVKTLGAASTDASSVYANVYYVLRTGGRVLPYIGVGAGYSMLDMATEYSNGAYFGSANKKQSGLGFGLSTGVEAYLASSLTLDIGYRYSYLGQLEFPMSIYDYDTARNGGVNAKLVYRDDTTLTMAAHEITIGIRYQF